MQTRTFPSEVFARLAPELYFQRHVENGQRPTGRKFSERRPVELRQGDASTLSESLGSAVVRAGGATVICGITGGLTKFKNEGGIYANVEIHRGGSNGNPSLEEQVLTMSVHRLVEAARFEKSDFDVDDENDLCLNAQIVVLSRTGPMLDLVWHCLVSALKSTKIPKFAQDEQTLQPSPTNDTYALTIPSALADVHRSYGLLEHDILADLDGAVEEECVTDRMSLAYSTDAKKLTGFSISASNGLGLHQLDLIIIELFSI